MLSLLDLINHFDGLAQRAPGIASFIHGDVDTVVERTRNKMEYPCMWMETPDVDIVDCEDSTTICYSFTVIIIDKVSRKTYQEARKIMSRLLILSIQLMLRMRQDAKRNKAWWIDKKSLSNSQLSPKLVGTEIDAGWAVEFVIHTPAPCLDEEAMPPRP